jgi:hypothetical protein
MALRCGCPDEADETVFGPMHRCSVDPKPPTDLPRFVPSSWFVVPPEQPWETTLSDDTEPGDLG